MSACSCLSLLHVVFASSGYSALAVAFLVFVSRKSPVVETRAGLPRVAARACVCGRCVKNIQRPYSAHQQKCPEIVQSLGLNRVLDYLCSLLHFDLVLDKVEIVETKRRCLDLSIVQLITILFVRALQLRVDGACRR